MLDRIAGGHAMVVTLSPRAEELIRRQLETGPYQSADEVIEQALSLLDEHERRQHLRAMIQVGLDQLDRGEVIPLTPELWDEIDREVDERLLRGDQPNPDVCVRRATA
jgi:antitoxin ParD1/3/4